MSVYRRKTSAGKSRFWTAEFQYRGRTYRKSGLPDRESAKHWLNTEQLRMRRGAVGYVKPMLAAKVMPLITAYADYLRGRGRDEMYAYITERRLTRLAGDCGWLTIASVTRDSLVGWLTTPQTNQAGRNRGKAMSNRTKNQYLDTATEWGDWLAKPAQSKLPSNPFGGVDRLPAKHNDDYRRAATVEELNRLLATCPTNRRLYYIFRIYTPLRGKTIGALTWRMMHLDATHPFVQTPAEWNKSKKVEKHAIRHEVAQELRALKKRTKAKADDAVFCKPPNLAQWRLDLGAAGVAEHLGNTSTGRLDFHALRKTLVAIGKADGLSPWQMMDLIGWKDIRTMMKHYNAASLAPEQAATMAKLPTIGSIRRAQC
jgi:hypothetical protein